MITITARELVRQSLQAIGAVSPSAPMKENEATDGLLALRGFINSLSVHELTLGIVARTVYALELGTASYVLGVGQASPNWDGARPPLGVQAANLVDSNGYEYPLEILTDARRAAIVDKALEGWPTGLYYNRANPAPTITLWPVPTDTNLASVALYTATPMSDALTLDSSLALPPGAYEALMYGLALRVAPTFGVVADPSIGALAAESLGTWKRSNITEHLLDIDEALIYAGTAGFDWRTGQ